MRNLRTWWPFRHLGLKFLSIALAVLLWMVVAGEETVERGLRIPLELQQFPAGLELEGEPPSLVDARVRGSSGTLSRLSMNLVASSNPALRLFLAKYSARRQAARRTTDLALLCLVRGHTPRARKDCSAGAAKSQEPIHEADHVWPRLLLCIPNSWERSGRRPAEKERWRLCKTAGNMWPCSSSSTASLNL